MLWIPGPKEIFLIVIVWAAITFGSGLLVWLVMLVRRRKGKQGDR